MRTKEISNADSVIDSRDVIARIEELQGQKADYDADAENGPWSDTDMAGELAALLALQEEAEGYAPDWEHGATLIRDSYFTEYAQELAEDCGMVPKDLGWPCTCIDWEQAAKELRMDYTSVEFDGVDYWVR